MLRQEPTLTIHEATHRLERCRTTIGWWARRLRVGRRGQRREWRFTEGDLERLEQAMLHRDRPRRN